MLLSPSLSLPLSLPLSLKAIEKCPRVRIKRKTKTIEEWPGYPELFPEILFFKFLYRIIMEILGFAKTDENVMQSECDRHVINAAINTIHFLTSKTTSLRSDSL